MKRSGYVFALIACVLGGACAAWCIHITRMIIEQRYICIHHTADHPTLKGWGNSSSSFSSSHSQTHQLIFAKGNSIFQTCCHQMKARVESISTLKLFRDLLNLACVQSRGLSR